MRIILKILFFIFVSTLFVANSEAVIVLKVKNKQALIHLEGVNTKRGAYFEAIDLYGKKKGILQIKRVGQKKAIGVLKWGKIAKRWSLEPISKNKALAVKKMAKRKVKLALIQKKKIKRKLAKQKILLKKRMAAKRKKQRRRRSIASNNQEEYILNDMPKEFQEFPSDSSDYQSQEVLADDSGYEEEGFRSSDQNQDKNFDFQEVYDAEPKGPKQLSAGIAPRMEFGLMQVNPNHNPGYMATGLGYGLSVFADFALNNLIRTEGSLGFKRFAVHADENKCGERRGCSVEINYITAGLSLKMNIMDFNDHKLWGALEGVLMYPMRPPVSNQILENESFDPPHGTLGLALGTDITMGNFIFPISFRSGFHIPPSKGAVVGNAGLQLGVAYNF